MLSLFPMFLDWNWYIPFFFRLFLGYYFFDLGLHIMKKGDGNAWKTAGGLAALAGIFFVLGAFTQLLGIVSGIFSLFLAFTTKKYKHMVKEPRLFFVLLALVSFSLLFLGAGPYAIDLPL